MGIQELAVDNSIITLPGTRAYRRASDSKWVTPALGKSGVREVLLGSNGVTTTEFPALMPHNGRGARGFTFDGGDYINCGDNDSFSFAPNNAFSIAFLVNQQSAATDFVVEKGTEYRVYIHSTGMIYASKLDADTGGYISRVTAAGVFVVGVPTVVVATFAATALASGIKIYQQGERVDSADSNFGAYVDMQNTGNYLVVGNSLTGDVVLPSLFDFELNQTEVQALTDIIRRTAGVP